MKSTSQLSRSQKISLIARLVEGDTTPMLQYKAAKDAPFVYLLDATQTFPADRPNTLDGRTDDLITGIKLTSTYADGKPNKVEPIPDMLRRDFDQWHHELRENGCPVVGFMRTLTLE